MFFNKLPQSCKPRPSVHCGTSTWQRPKKAARQRQFGLSVRLKKAAADADNAATVFVKRERNMTCMSGEMSQMVAKGPNAGAVRHHDWRGFIEHPRGEGFLPIAAHGSTPTGRCWILEMAVEKKAGRDSTVRPRRTLCAPTLGVFDHIQPRQGIVCVFIAVRRPGHLLWLRMPPRHQPRFTDHLTGERRLERGHPSMPGAER